MLDREGGGVMEKEAKVMGKMVGVIGMEVIEWERRG